MKVSEELQNRLNWTIIAALLAGLYVSSYYNYLLFHSISEIFSIVIGFALFVVAWNTRRVVDNRYFLFIGIAFLFAAFLDLFHLFSYKGMGIFAAGDANLPTQLWIAARFLEAVSLLLAPFFIRTGAKAGTIFSAYLAVTSALLISIELGIFPDCYVEGSGLTAFKIYSEYAICAVLAAALMVLVRHGGQFDRKVLNLLVASILATIVSELAFTFYIDVYGLSNMVGHYFKIVAFYLIYKAIVVTGLEKPYDVLFRNLAESEARLRERTRQLEDANRELESFAYSVSHDLRAPLRAINGFSEMLLKEAGPGLEPESKRKFGVIRENALKMGQLIEDILHFSRTGRTFISRSGIDLEALVQDVWNEIRDGNPERNMELKVYPLPTVTGDRALLRQVFANLLGNAVKFTRNRELAVIEVTGSVSGPFNLYCVRDNGVGFDMQYHDKLFEMFRRLHSSRDFEGTGVGLAIVKKIIDKHGGRIWAESKPGEGAAFSFTLPSGVEL